MTTVTIRTEDGNSNPVQLLEVDGIQAGIDFIKQYANGQQVRFWNSMEIVRIRYSIEAFDLDEDGVTTSEEIYSRDYTQTLSRFTFREMRA